MRREQRSIYKQLLELIQEINGGGIIHRVYEDAPAQSIRVGRRKGEIGLWEGEQRIVSATISNKECMAVVLEITYLAAGFIVGCKGEAMKQIWKKTGASIRSNAGKKKDAEQIYTARLFSISGTHTQILETVHIFVAAVNRYKELVEGKRSDEVVNRSQVVEGITFQYCPPPISAIPYSARTMDFPGKTSDQIQQRQEENLEQYSEPNRNLVTPQNSMKENIHMNREFAVSTSAPMKESKYLPNASTPQSLQYPKSHAYPHPLPPPPPPPSTYKYYPYYTTSMPMPTAYNYYTPSYRYAQLHPYSIPSSAYGGVVSQQESSFVKSMEYGDQSPFIHGQQQHPFMYWGQDSGYALYPASPTSRTSSYDFVSVSPTSRSSSYDSLVQRAYVEPCFQPHDQFAYTNNMF